MLFIVIVMIVILVVAGLVLAYAAYPHQADSLPPSARRLGDALAKATDAVSAISPFIDEDRTTAEGADRPRKASLFE